MKLAGGCGNFVFRYSNKRIMKHEKSICRLEKIHINNSDQWVLVRGKNAHAPLLIHVQGGSGLPMIAEANELERRLHLEDHFLVAYWDQRGCGKSFCAGDPAASLSLSQMADDVIACTRYLLKKYNKPSAVLVGYSIGATVGLMAAADEGGIFSALIAVGIDVDIP